MAIDTSWSDRASGTRPGALLLTFLERRRLAVDYAACAPWAVAATMLTYLLYAGFHALYRHEGFGSYGCDLGIYDQTLWLISQGLSPFSTVRGLHILADHFTPVLYLLAPFYRLGLGPEVLLWAQTAALAAGAWPLYRIGMHVTRSPRVAVLGVVAYLLYPPVRSVNLFDFHPVVLATPGLFLALWGAVARRPWALAAGCAWTVLCKQEAAVVVACIGVWYAVRWRQPRALLVSAAGIAWFVAATRLIAYYAGTSESSYIELYSQYGSTTGEVLRTFLLEPWKPLMALGTPRTAVYFAMLLVPVALLPLRSPGILVMMAFPLALNLFSNRVLMRHSDYWYTALLTPFLLTAAVVTIARVTDPVRRRRVAAGWAFCACVGAFGVEPQEWWTTRVVSLPTAEANATRSTLAAIPPGASLSATHSLIPHVAHRKEIYLFPNPFLPMAWGTGREALRQQQRAEMPLDRAALRDAVRRSSVEYLALGYRLNSYHSPFPLSDSQYVPVFGEALRHPSYGLIREEAGIFLLRRGADHRAGLKQLGLAPEDPASRFETVVQQRLDAVPDHPRKGEPQPRMRGVFNKLAHRARRIRETVWMLNHAPTQAGEK